MITLSQLPGVLVAVEPEIWGQTVRQCVNKIKTLAVSGAKDHFRTATSPDGHPWKPLAHPRPGGGDKPLRDKGLLMASLSATETPTGIELKASGPGVNVHQFGATIRAKRGKFLTIPLTRDAKRAGSPRQNGFPRPLFALKLNNQVFLAEAKEKGPKRNRVTNFTLHYVLKSAVTIPARPFIGYSQKTLDAITQILWESYYTNLFQAIKDAKAAHDEANFIF